MAAVGGVAQGVGDEVVENGVQGAAIALHIRDVFERHQLDIDVLLPGLVSEAVERIAEGVDGADFLDFKLAPAGFQFSDFDEVEHQIVKMLGFFGSAVGQLRLQWTQFPGMALGKGIERKTQAMERSVQPFARPRRGSAI